MLQFEEFWTKQSSMQQNQASKRRKRQEGRQCQIIISPKNASEDIREYLSDLMEIHGAHCRVTVDEASCFFRQGTLHHDSSVTVSHNARSNLISLYMEDDASEEMANFFLRADKTLRPTSTVKIQGKDKPSQDAEACYLIFRPEERPEDTRRALDRIAADQDTVFVSNEGSYTCHLATSELYGDTQGGTVGIRHELSNNLITVQLHRRQVEQCALYLKLAMKADLP